MKRMTITPMMEKMMKRIMMYTAAAIDGDDDYENGVDDDKSDCLTCRRMMMAVMICMTMSVW